MEELNMGATGTDTTNPSGQPFAGLRLKLGIFLFGLSILMPIVGVPLVAMLVESTAATASITGGLLVAAEVMGLVAIGIMGKSGYAYLKSRLQGLLKQYGPPNKVGPVRYKTGLVLFSLPILFGWVSIYTAKWIPGFESHPLFYAIGGDIMIVVSLFVLGGDFWDKVRSLFIHTSEARFF
jgi:hypothetical protein